MYGMGFIMRHSIKIPDRNCQDNHFQTLVCPECQKTIAFYNKHLIKKENSFYIIFDCLNKEHYVRSLNYETK